MPIKLLPPQLANQIAAGEVVERPASVVKELVENSIDAGATQIEIDIEKGGHKRIKIRDNGQGIAKDELALALSRHATSKIATLDDLEQILSLGFRGEALASISSVSRLTLTSKPARQEQAWQAHCHGRDMDVKLNPAAHPNGTTIDVADLFYNTPARRKFLRTEKTEFQHIDDIIKRIALSHNDVGFTLRHNAKTIRRWVTRSQEERSKRIADVVGQKFIGNSTYLKTDYDGVKIEAWLGSLGEVRSSNDCQFSFVNGRGMRDKLILHALRQAYEMTWGIAEQPAFVVFLTVPPRDVDVNVHPAKHEVRFQQARLIHDFLVQVVSQALNPEPSGMNNLEGYQHQPNHDYIQPLSHSVQERIPTPAARPTNLNAGSGNSTSRASVATPRGQANYNSYFTALMTTTNNESVAGRSELESISLSEDYRLFILNDKAYLLSSYLVFAKSVIAQINAASTSQPLLMPVALEMPTTHQPQIDLLRGVHFKIDRVAGKVRLQHVPAGCRHLPWVKLFPLLLRSESDSAETMFLEIIHKDTGLDQHLVQQGWEWFKTFSVEEQEQMVLNNAGVVSTARLLALWEQ
ncbi:DNA mismatch repair endonuclease MutL [Alteromonas sp. ASW11-130]|uniref:DNA mismatch repair endonuclease MutL n=1 Tax=Alteromonas sp. ASW11-130 TaxID=3015775 RepID=UPI002242B276|nr:DNA mismatch repair endonuclease MutL [Alteromonas sp. ASW11-130]MCW8090773.1 DNA mismatch repair endonuclease MutL [Alteromonas sp. ASW11-130]